MNRSRNRRKKNLVPMWDVLEERQLLSSTVTNPDGSTTTTTDSGSVINYSHTGNGPQTLTAYDATTINSGDGTAGGYIDASDHYSHVSTVVDYHNGATPQTFTGDAQPSSGGGWITSTLLGPYHNAVWHYSNHVTETMDLTHTDGSREHLSFDHVWPAVPQDQYNPPDNVKPDGSRPGRLQYDLSNPSIVHGMDLVYIPTDPADSFGNYVNMVGHKFDVYVRPGSDANGLTRAIKSVTWKIPDAIVSSSWSPSAGFQNSFMTDNFDPTTGPNANRYGTYNSVSAYWAHGNPDRPDAAPITSGGQWDFQTIEAHVTYYDGTDEVLDSRVPVAVPSSTYSSQFGTVSLGPSHINGDTLAIKTGDPSYEVGSGGIINTVGPQGYTGTMTIDPNTTWAAGGTFGMLQTVNAYITRTWADTNQDYHTQEVLMKVDPVTGHLVYSAPFLDDDATDQNVLYQYQTVGTGTPFVRQDSPTLLVMPDFVSYVENESFMEYGMYRPGATDDRNSIPVPLFNASWGFSAYVNNNVPGGFGSNYSLDPDALINLGGSGANKTGAYPTWTANAAIGAAQVSTTFQQISQYHAWSGAPGPHDPTWFTASLDNPDPVYVSTPNPPKNVGQMILLDPDSIPGHPNTSELFGQIPVRKRDRLVAQALKNVDDFGFDFLSHRRTHAAG